MIQDICLFPFITNEPKGAHTEPASRVVSLTNDNHYGKLLLFTEQEVEILKEKTKSQVCGLFAYVAYPFAYPFNYLCSFSS